MDEVRAAQEGGALSTASSPPSGDVESASNDDEEADGDESEATTADGQKENSLSSPQAVDAELFPPRGESWEDDLYTLLNG